MNTATLSAGRLKRALAFVQQTIDRHNAIPVLGMVRIDFDSLTGNALVSGTDLDIGLESQIDISMASRNFTVILPPRPLVGFLRACDDDDAVTVAVNLARIVTITAADCTMSLRELCAPEDWRPFGPSAIAPKRAEINGDLLRKALAAVAPCISAEETRYYLCGVYFHAVDMGMAMVATNGHRLALYKTDVAMRLPSFILPDKAAKILLRAVGKGNGAPVTVEARPNHVSFTGNGWTIRSKTIDDTYPDYTRVMPSADREVKITATITAHALRRLPTLQQYMSQEVKIEPDEGRMSVSADGITATAPATGSGRRFGLDIRYLRGMAYPAGTVKLIGLTAGGPFIVQTDDPALTQIIMPMRVE